MIPDRDEIGSRTRRRWASCLRASVACGALALLLVSAACTAAAQDVSLEYRVKATYIYYFAQFVEWPADAVPDPLTICVAGRNPFGPVLEETLRGETINGRPVGARVILEPESGCHVVFVPHGAATTAYLRAAAGTPTLTIGESADFIDQGGMANFYLDDGNVRIEISPAAAERAGLRVSSRLLQLARIVGAKAEVP
jgi:hypothetical protein